MQNKKNERSRTLEIVIRHPYQIKVEKLQHPQVNRFTKPLAGSIVMQILNVNDCRFACLAEGKCYSPRGKVRGATQIRLAEHDWHNTPAILVLWMLKAQERIGRRHGATAEKDESREKD